MSVLPTLFRRVYVKSRPQCPLHGERDMVRRTDGAYRCTFGATDIYVKTVCDYVSAARVRVSRVEPDLDDFEDEKPWFGDVDRDSL